MHSPRHILALLACCSLRSALADFLTPTYPAPIHLSSNDSLVFASWKDLSSIFDNYLKDPKKSTAKSLSGAENVTFSVGMFSLHDPAATKLQYHYTAPEIANSTYGTNKVDGDSIYRVASVSKLITTYAGLLEITEQDWNRPLSDIIPGLRDYVQSHTKNPNPIYITQWDKITPWALATQLSGVATLGLPTGDLSLVIAAAAAEGEPNLREKYGFPPFNFSTLGPCATNLLQNPSDSYCPAPEAIASLDGLSPNFLPWTTPVYSDEGFMLLGMAISNITGKPVSTIYQDSVFNPLGMTSSNSTHPTSGSPLARSVIAGDPSQSFALETGFTTPSGGILSTVNDLSKFGIAILNNTLLTAETTRKWMKPQTHTASYSYSIGAGWEIHRYVQPQTGRLTDLYTKLGDSGFYGGALVLIPQYDAGFTLLNGSNDTNRSPTALAILDYVTEAVLPALEAQAAAEAKRNYAGTYVSADGDLNASVTIAFNASTVPGIISGLAVTAWTFNGTDVLAGPLFNGMKPRLEPSIVHQSADDGSPPNQVAFQASLQPQTLTYSAAVDVPKSGVIGTWTGFYASNGDFVYTDEILTRYGGIGAHLFVFDVDVEGNAVACSPAVQRVVLKRI